MQTYFSNDLYTTFSQVETLPCPGLNVLCLKLAAMHRLRAFICYVDHFASIFSKRHTRAGAIIHSLLSSARFSWRQRVDVNQLGA